jgi:hypothetical protein
VAKDTIAWAIKIMLEGVRKVAYFLRVFIGVAGLCPTVLIGDSTE